ncbi:MAG: hypothetical protein ACXWAC_11855 [Usitatibacter sp.]
MAFVIGACLATPAAADTFLQLQPFDAFGSPLPVQSWTGATAAFAVTSQADSGVTVNVSTGTGPWTIAFSPRSGQSLATFFYDNAAIAPTSAFPGLTVYQGPTGCVSSYGQFTVRELVVASGVITQFAADFEHHCNGDSGGPVYVGGIRINSAAPYVPPGLAPLPPASLQLAAQAQEWISHGFNGTITRAAADFTFRMPSPGELDVELQSPGSRVDRQWGLWFTAPTGAALAPGLYDNITLFPGAAGSQPTLRVVSQYACLQVTGRFNIVELELGPMNRPIKLAIDFEQHCEGAPEPLYGALRLNSSAPFTPGAFPALPASMSAAGNSTIVARFGSGALTGPSYRAFDSAGHAMAGTPIRFLVPASCGTYAGGSIANLLGTPMSEVDVMTDANGLAAMPSFTPAAATVCYAQVVLLGAPSLGGSIITLVVYDPAQLSVSAVPVSLTTDAGQPFRVGVAVSFQNFGLPHLPVASSVRSSTGAGASLAAMAETDANGMASFDATANAFGGTYEIVLTVEGNARSIGITQRGPPAPGPQPPFTTLVPMEDMWWSPSENGWGMSLIQHGDMLFGALYIYDANGKPIWVVLPNGTWDSTRTIYSGPVYKPIGTPFYAYNAQGLFVGNAVGNVTITFQDANNAILDYTLAGLSGRKLITREIFATGPAASPDRSDLWWGGSAQNGWGITVLQQGSTLFSVWYTYDANGNATWYVMPGGAWTSSDTYEGPIYRTTSSPWAGATYDPAQLKVFDVGTYRIRFTGDAATFDYAIDGRSGTLPLVRQAF